MRIAEVTAAHGDLIAHRFPHARDVSTLGALYEARLGGAGGPVVGFGFLAGPAPHEPPYFRGAVHIEPQFRGRGHGRRLARYLVAMADRLGAPALRPLEPIRDDKSDRLLACLGFHEVSGSTLYSFCIGKPLEIASRVVGAIDRRGRSTDFSFLPYEKAPQEPVERLCMAGFGALTHGHMKAAGQYAPARGEDASQSLALMKGNELAAALGVVVRNATARFDPLLIAPKYQNGPAFAAIITEMCRRLLARGVTGGEAEIHDGNAKMLTFVRRLDARAGARSRLFERQHPNLAS